MIYFRGCVVREKLENVFEATEEILKLAGLDYQVLPDEGCCGSFLLRTGFQDEALEVMEKTLKGIKDEKIVVSCAGCYKTFKNDYKEFFSVELDIMHTSQLFGELIEENKLKIKKTDLKVTYHDPCHLGRHCGEYESPRNVLKRTAQLVEMERNRERSSCCGAGAGVKSAFPEDARQIAENRITDAEKTGADILVSSCSFCILNLKSACENEKKGKIKCLEVKDISEILKRGIEI